MSRKTEPKEVKYYLLKDSDHPCDLHCGMLAQCEFKGVTQDWKVCWTCAARVISGFINTSIVVAE